MDLDKLMNPDQPSPEEDVADELLRKLDRRLEKLGKAGDGQAAMRIVLLMAEAINESEEDAV